VGPVISIRLLQRDARKRMAVQNGGVNRETASNPYVSSGLWGIQRIRPGYLAAMDTSRAWAEVNLDAIRSNLGRVRQRIGPAPGIILVVKADAYGHGAVAVAHHALGNGADALGVGTVAEGLELRKSGIRERILVLGTLVDSEAIPALCSDLELGLHSYDRCRFLQRVAKERGAPAKVHLKVDTGMGRLGVLPERTLPLLRRIRAASHLELAGVMTHVASPKGALAESTGKQTRLFDALIGEARREQLIPPSAWIHVANSACVFTDLRPIYDAVRIGISALGLVPGIPAARELLQPALSLHSRVVFLKDLPRGSPLGYGPGWTAPRRTRMATLPIGYDDGVAWRLGNRGEVLVRGTRAKIIGPVSMDYTTIDVTHIPGVKVGDSVTLIGTDGDQEISVEDIATLLGTIPYEITCSIGRRVGRIYRESSGHDRLPDGRAGATHRSQEEQR